MRVRIPMLAPMQDGAAVPRLEYARELARATSLSAALIATQREMLASAGYANVWLALREDEHADELRVLDVAGAMRDVVLEQLPTIPIAGDAMILEILEQGHVVVVEDARTDPRTNKAIVQALGNRTIVNVPLVIHDKPFGALGFGTFGDEGVRPPSARVVAHAIGVASLLAVTLARIRVDETTRHQAEREREIEHRLARIQRLDTVGTLAGGVAHDFNNLLTALMTGLSLARSAPTREALEVELDVMGSILDRAQALTRQLLSMSRERTVTFRPTDLGVLLQRVEALFKRVLPASIKLIVHAPPLRVMVDGDGVQLEQVLMNLCVNARDAMLDGGHLTVAVEHVDIGELFRQAHPWAKTGAYAMITVSDTGCGIAPEHRERIFDPFFTTKEEGRGTGLGLSIAHGIVTQHGGMLHCYSELGSGTTFKIYLPVSEAGSHPPPRSIAPEVPGGSERILLGEDDDILRAAARRVLENAGYVVNAVADGAAILTALEREVFDVVVLDAMMPGKSCAQTVAEIVAKQHGLPIVLCSGYSADAKIEDVVRTYGLRFLAKPYAPEALLRLLRSVIDERQTAAGS